MNKIATMMVTVIKPFFDNNNPGKKYLPGQEVRFEISRAEDLISKGVVSVETEPETEPVVEKEKILREKKTPKILDME